MEVAAAAAPAGTPASAGTPTQALGLAVCGAQATGTQVRGLTGQGGSRCLFRWGMPRGAHRSQGRGRCPPELGHQSHVPGRTGATHDFAEKLWPGWACWGAGRSAAQPEPGSPRGFGCGGQAPGWGWQTPSMTHHCSITWLSVASLRVEGGPRPQHGGSPGVPPVVPGTAGYGGHCQHHPAAWTRTWCPCCPCR